MKGSDRGVLSQPKDLLLSGLGLARSSMLNGLQKVEDYLHASLADEPVEEVKHPPLNFDTETEDEDSINGFDMMFERAGAAQGSRDCVPQSPPSLSDPRGQEKDIPLVESKRPSAGSTRQGDPTEHSEEEEIFDPIGSIEACLANAISFFTSRRIILKIGTMTTFYGNLAVFLALYALFSLPMMNAEHSFLFTFVSIFLYTF